MSAVSGLWQYYDTRGRGGASDRLIAAVARGRHIPRYGFFWISLAGRVGIPQIVVEDGPVGPDNKTMEVGRS